MGKGRPKGHSPYTDISYGELGDWLGRKSMVKVSKLWLDSLMGELTPHKAQEALSKPSRPETAPTSKECSKCKRSLPLHEFSNDKRRKLGKRSQCKRCNKGQHSNPTTKEEFPKIEYKLTNFNDK